MIRLAETSQIAKFSTAEANPLQLLWTGVVRVVSCFVLVIVLSMFTAPSSAQAHGMHGSQGVTATNAVTDAETQAVSSDRTAISASKCITCCVSSSCAAVSLPDSFEMSNFDMSKNDFWAASTVPAFQMASSGLRRPPKLIS